MVTFSKDRLYSHMLVAANSREVRTVVTGATEAKRMSTTEIKGQVRRAEDAVNARDYDAFGEIFANDFVLEREL
ncbi:hypothetical protein CP556_23710 [Natrinema sp. CBA1119]|uniref:hypothetical protein n=1 Tax=Natrinema sp. CBA1119 TaxID=1608465 RepID=UPI000BF53D3D|nr:hypothetical protein [Natrinema sp. CBA1119]PGF14068.1 hypothetical protein CP556_23710 [Natrinema sp. CBA1119]